MDSEQQKILARYDKSLQERYACKIKGHGNQLLYVLRHRFSLMERGKVSNRLRKRGRSSHADLFDDETHELEQAGYFKVVEVPFGNRNSAKNMRWENAPTAQR